MADPVATASSGKDSSDVLFDSKDSRYSKVLEIAFQEWDIPLADEDVVQFLAFAEERGQETVVSAALRARNAGDEEVVRWALCDSLEQFQESTGLLYILSRKQLPKRTEKLLLCDAEGEDEDDTTDSIHRLKVRIAQSKTAATPTLSVELIQKRAFEVSYWLLPLSGLERNGLCPLEVMAACKGRMKPSPDVARDEELARRIDTFIDALDGLLQSHDVTKVTVEGSTKEEPEGDFAFLLRKLGKAPSPTQSAIFQCLNGQMMDGVELSVRTGFSSSAIGVNIRRMKDAGIVVPTGGRQGYYRPDAPPSKV